MPPFTRPGLILALSLFIILSSSRPATNAAVTDCNGAKAIGKLVSVSITNCDLVHQKQCILEQGTNATIVAKFLAEQEFNGTLVDVHGKIGSFYIPFPLHPDDACGNYGFNCPVQANTAETLSITVPVLESYPRIALQIRVRMYDRAKVNEILCLQAPVKIVRSSKSNPEAPNNSILDEFNDEAQF